MFYLQTKYHPETDSNKSQINHHTTKYNNLCIKGPLKSYNTEHKKKKKEFGKGRDMN